MQIRTPANAQLILAFIFINRPFPFLAFIFISMPDWRGHLTRAGCGDTASRMARNVLGTGLMACSQAPLTGFFRTGVCDTCAEDRGMHTICARMTAEFLAFTAARGNDLTTPAPQYGFPGLRPGDFWCLCLGRWVEAHQAGCAPPVKLEATHASVLEFVDLEVLRRHAVEAGD
jgi:uncharacterized protein